MIFAHGGAGQPKEEQLRYVAFDLEIHKEVPDGADDWKEHRPLGITCASTLTEALAIARDATPQTPKQGDPKDPQGLAPGMVVSVTHLGEGGDAVVHGAVHYVERETVAILREDPKVGAVCVHFPRVGYRVAKA